MKHRVKNIEGSYDGGPMYFLPRAFKGKWIAPVICILLCIYGVELFQTTTLAKDMLKYKPSQKLHIALLEY